MAYTNAIFFLDPDNGSDAARTALASVTFANNGSGGVRATKTGHGLVTGAVVDITGSTVAAYNSAWIVTFIDLNNFDLSTAVFSSAATGGAVTPRGGASKADAWKTISSGATSARISPGDTVRLIASPDETLLGSATWTYQSKTITLAAAVTANISDCETAWTPATNITSTADTSLFKENTKAARLVSNATFTTGLVAYWPLGAVTDLSAYQQVSFWVNNAQAIADGATLSLRLCSDTAGAVTVKTIAIPAVSTTNAWTPITVDLNAALGSNIQSVALYADKAFTSRTILIDNILACKAASAADSLSLTSLIGKAHNVRWLASTAYALNDVRKPSQPNRTGFRYKVTTAGTTGATEPAWPQEIGVTVTDGTVVWTCDDVEETWYCIQSINGTTVKIDQHVAATGSAGRGYGGTTETATTYKREVINLPINSGYQFQKAGTDAAPITYSGGWDRTSMAAQTGETWLSGQNGTSQALSAMLYMPVAFNVLSNLNGVRSASGLVIAIGPVTVNFCHFNHHTSYGLNSNGPTAGGTIKSRGLITNNNQNYGSYLTNYGCPHIAERFASLCNNADGIRLESNWPGKFKGVVGRIKNNAGVPFVMTTFGGMPAELSSVITANNSGVINAFHGLIANNCTFGEGDPTPAGGSGGNGNADRYVYLHKYNQAVNSHKIIGEGGTISAATDQLHTAGGIAWKFNPTSTSIRHSLNPLKLTIAKIACAANAAVSLTVWTRRSSTDIKGRLVALGGTVAGVPADVVVDAQPAINGWFESSTLTFTPTEAGVVEIQFWVSDSVGTTNSFWIQDLSVS